MRSITAKALALLPPVPFSVGETETEYGRVPRKTRAIRDKRGVDLVRVVATTAIDLKDGDELEEENNPSRVHTANTVAALWSRSAELMAALGDLLDGIQSGRFPAAHTVDYAERVLRETERAILAGAGEDSTEASNAAQ